MKKIIWYVTSVPLTMCFLLTLFVQEAACFIAACCAVVGCLFSRFECWCFSVPSESGWMNDPRQATLGKVFKETYYNAHR